MKRVLTLLLALVLAVTSVPLSVSAFGSCATVAVDLSDTNYSESNVYVRTARSWSFLHPLEDGRMMTLNYIERQERIEVSYYTSDFVLQETLSIYPDLPIWGGFYATDDAYYLFTGQKNMDESPDVEVIRVTKYNTDWEEEGYTSLYDVDVVSPFSAGQVRCAVAGNILAVHTAREMYYSSGSNHQANFSFSINTDTMEFLGYRKGKYVSSGYTSHSFDQYIYYDGEKFVTVDHGDGSPRAVVLHEHYPASFKEPNKIDSQKYAYFFEMPGEAGDNDTGLSTGGFAVSPSSYIVVGTSRWDDVNDPALRSRPYNVFVSVLDRTTHKNTRYMLTDYNSGFDKEKAYTPYLVKISDSSFMVLWSDCEGTVYYQKLDGNGKPVGNVYSMEGRLSYVQPQVINGKVTWYTHQFSEIQFYTISTSDWSDTDVTYVNNGHGFIDENDEESHWRLCIHCGDTAYLEPHDAYTIFSGEGTRDTKCKECAYVESDPIHVTIMETESSSGGITLRLGLKTASGLTLTSDDLTFKRTAITTFQENGKTYAKKVTYKFTNTGDKQGSFSRTFYRLPNTVKVASIAPQPYTGKAVKPAVKVTHSNNDLQEGVDYTLTYKNNTKKGTATVVIDGIGNYFGSTETTFSIVENITGAKVSGITDKVFNGAPYTQNLKVVLDGKTLKEGTDYTVEYKNNTKVGTATVTIKGKGAYAGTIQKTFKITAQGTQGTQSAQKTDIGACKVSLSATAYTYNGKAKSPAVTVKNAAGKTLKKNTDYTVTYAAGRKNVGTYKVTVKMKGNYSGQKTLSFKINPPKTTVKKVTAAKKSLKVTLNKKTSQVTGYEVQYSTSKAFKSAKTKVINKAKTTALTIKSLKAKKTYYVRVRTYKTVGGKKYYSAWSAAKSKKTK